MSGSPPTPPPESHSSAPDWLAGLAERARAHDGQPPFSDGSLIELAAGSRTVLTIGSSAAALVSATEAELVVDPDARRRGLGEALLSALLARSRGELLFWAHGDHPGARALARRHGFEPVRTLLHLRAPVPAAELPTSVGGRPQTPAKAGNSTSLTTFDLERDADDWLALNARAFAEHPEQGAVARADLEVLTREPWFDADDFLLLRDANDHLVGYCWLKVEGAGLEHADGEFYVVGVDPSRQGEGLGGELVEAGFARLAERGIRRAHLYVEEDNTAAVRLYHRFGFRTDTVDLQYARVERTLAGGNMGAVTRLGGTVLRESGPWTPTVHRLLRHLRNAGIPGIPEPLGMRDGRESLCWVDGEVPVYPLPDAVWSETLLVDAVTRLRDIHDASLTFDRTDAVWRQPVHEPTEVVCHNDFAPYNLVLHGERLAGVIDWDMASPGPRVWDLAYLAYRLVPFCADDAPAVDTEARLSLLLETYGGIGRAELIATMLERLEHLAVFTDEQAALQGRVDLTEHAALYRRDAAAIRAGTPPR